MRTIVVTGIVAALAACSGGSRERAADLASFDLVWTTVRDRHFDPTFGGVDWDAARTELRPRVAGAHDRAEARAVMRELIGKLELSHFAIVEVRWVPPDELHDRVGTVGLDVRALDGGVVVTAVDDDGPAARAGVEPGWLVEAVGGTAVSELLAPVRAAQAGVARTAAEALTVKVKLGGAVEGAVDVTFRDGSGRAVATHLIRDRPRGQVTHLGIWPAVAVELTARRLGPDGTVGYLGLNSFHDPARIMPALREALAGMADTRGLVLDLRGNLGGMAAMAIGIAGLLVDHVVVFGTTKARDEESRFVVNPQAHPYRAPVAVLVDELSASTSEILTSGLQELGRARVFGRRTLGEALPSHFQRLPNGDGFQFPIASYVSSGGRTLEGHGVEPDEVVPLVRASLLAGDDDTLSAALRWIESRTAEELPR